MDKPKMTAKELEQYHFLATAHKRVEWEIANTLWRGWGLPAAWNEIATGPRHGRRVKVTLLLDEQVLKFFKVMGRGYHARINDVLKIWMYARLMKLVNGPESRDLLGESGLFATAKPDWVDALEGDEGLFGPFDGPPEDSAMNISDE